MKHSSIFLIIPIIFIFIISCKEEKKVSIKERLIGLEKTFGINCNYKKISLNTNDNTVWKYDKNSKNIHEFKTLQNDWKETQTFKVFTQGSNIKVNDFLFTLSHSLTQKIIIKIDSLQDNKSEINKVYLYTDEQFKNIKKINIELEYKQGNRSKSLVFNHIPL